MTDQRPPESDDPSTRERPKDESFIIPFLGMIVGIIVMPVVFAWFTLRPGYSKTVGRISIGYTAAVIATFLSFALLIAFTSNGQRTFGDFSAQRQVEHDAALRTSTDPNRPEGRR